MKTKRPLYSKVFIYTLVAIIINFWGSQSFGYEWSKTFGGGGDDEGRSIQQTIDGGYIIAAGWMDWSKDNFLIKTDTDGKKQWAKLIDFGGIDGINQMGSALQTTDGGYAVLGNGLDAAALSEPTTLRLIKTDADGNELWRNSIGIELLGTSFQQTTDGGYIITIISHSGPFEGIIRTDANGNVLWSKPLGGDETDRLYSVQQTSDGGYIIAGQTWSFWQLTKTDVVLIKTDALGNELWSNTFGGSEPDSGNSVQQTTDGGYIMVGVKGHLGAGSEPSSVAIGDLNGDTKPDLAVANSHSNNVSVLLGNGDGSFQAAVNYGTGGGSSSVAIGDLNKDGNLDLAMMHPHYAGDYVSVLLGNGDGSFQSPVNYGAERSSVAIGDLDGDGNLYLVTGFVSVLL